ncbi:JAB domain-containing protein [Pseudomonas aeruginosa]|nr:JAB domain-containing protein [Pseudomonas aeruginosa]MDF5919958.1 JAB domain-containing protein [Pseudomonas aeruginosa]
MFRRGQELLSPRGLRQYLRLRLVGKSEEVFAAVFLDAQWRALFRGTVNAAPMYARVVVKRALRHNAVGVVVAHNHPSGLATPSQADIAATRQLKAALNLVDIELLDHFVIGRGEPFPFSTPSYCEPAGMPEPDRWETGRRAPEQDKTPAGARGPRGTVAHRPRSSGS